MPIKAALCSPVASGKLCTMIDAIESPGKNRCDVIWWLLPMSSATAIVSPIARPRPSIAAPISPLRTRGNTATRNISQRVAPMASAAFLSSCATVTSVSRLSDVMIGVIMTASTSPAVMKLVPNAWPPKNCSEHRPRADRVGDVRVEAADRRDENGERPEAVDDRRDRGEQVDDVGHRIAPTSGRELGDEQRDAEAGRDARSRPR